MTSSLMEDILDKRRGGCRGMCFLSAVAADHKCQYPQKCGNLTINYPFEIEGTNWSNVFASVGCYANGSFFSDKTPRAEGIIIGGSCATSCPKIIEPDMYPEYCNGFGCCQTILDPTTFFMSTFEIGKWGAGKNGLKLDWAIGEDGCSPAKQNGPLACSEHADCFHASAMPGYVCNCR
eukprot:Gb_03182 [translate_table: standard]